MCEMMGLCFRRPVVADFSMRAFSGGDLENPDGWGIAWYPDQSAGVVKEALTWRQSNFAQFIETYPELTAKVYVVHIRKKSTGGPATHADTHPFQREMGARDYCFAHNGTIREFMDLSLTRFQPVGGTDSERIFCHLLSEIDKHSIDLTQEESWNWLYVLLRKLNERGTVNCLLTDGERLFVYRDVGGWKGLSIRLVRFRHEDERVFEDESTEIAVSGDLANRGFVVATRPLSSTGWHPIALGSMLVLKDGNLLYSSEPGIKQELLPHRGGPAKSKPVTSK